MRGTWFYDGSWQPVEDGYATQIETEYLGKFLGHKLKEDAEPSQKGPKPGIVAPVCEKKVLNKMKDIY